MVSPPLGGLTIYRAPGAIEDHGAPVSTPTLKPHPKKPMKGTRGISWGPLLTPGPQAVPKFPLIVHNVLP
ncbi:unnamed protein product, partial [Staurois parvus]